MSRGALSSDRKVVLLAFPDEGLAINIEKLASGRFPNLTCFRSIDGFDAWSKMENFPPDVLILTSELPKRDGMTLVSQLLKNDRFEKVGVIFLNAPPESDIFTDEVVTGRVQFIQEFNEERLFRAMMKAFAHVAADDKGFRVVVLEEGQNLIKEGERADFVYLVRRGTLQAFHEENGQAVQLGRIESGEFVGEMAYISGEARSANVKALTDCELVQISLEHLDHVLYKKPTWAKALMSTLSKRLKRANEQKAP